ncbi:MAG: hypothetical protein HRF47_10245 [Chloroflexota bacterium]
MKKLTRQQYDDLDRALADVQDAEFDNRVGTHAILMATLAKIGYTVFSVQEAIEKAVSLLSEGWSDE